MANGCSTRSKSSSSATELVTGPDYILEIELGSDPSLRDELEGLLFLADSSGSYVVREDERRIVLRAFFESAALRSAAGERLEANPALQLREIDERKTDWLEHYEQSLEPMEIGERFIVAPAPELIRTGGRLALIVPQEQAFGTGSHETTTLCLSMLEQAGVEGAFCADIGTGSGILAIAMEKLGARRVVAFDDDPETWGVVSKNMQRNGVEPDRILQFVGGPESLAGARFSVIAMNIIPAVILPLLPHVRTLLKTEGRLIVSGILESEKGEVLEVARSAGLKLARQLTRGDWWCGELE
jgi:ribosomal protein L11 methyltransferase